MMVKEQLLNLKAYQPGKSIEEVKKEYKLEKIIKLASNENPFGCSELVKDAITNQLNHLALYPDGYVTNLREELATHLNIESNQLIFGNGSDDLIQMISRAILANGANTVMARPTFPQYRHNAIVEGAEIREVELLDGKHDLNGMLAQIDDATKIIWVCNPNNPTGEYISENELRSFLSKVPKHVLVVLDEAYYEYVEAVDYPNSLSLLKEFENIIILRTFSKAYGLASLRVGYGITNDEFIQKIEPIREPFNINQLAQVAAIAALGDQAFINQCVQTNREGLEQYYEFCQKNKLKYYPSQGNFILIDFNPLEGNTIFQYLLEQGFIVRSGNALGFPYCVRITVGTKEQNASLIILLEKLLAENK